MYDCNYFLLLKAKKLQKYKSFYGIYSTAYLVWLIGRLEENNMELLRKDVESCGW